MNESYGFRTRYASVQCFMSRVSVLFAFVTAVACSGMPAFGQASPESMRNRLRQQSALSEAEIRRLLELERQKLAEQPFRLVIGRRIGDTFIETLGQDYALEPNGHVRYIRSERAFTDYTGRPALSCNGDKLLGELVVEYQRAGAGWTVTARSSTPIDPAPAPMFQFLSGEPKPADAGLLGDDVHRVLTAPFSPGPIAVQTPLPNGGNGGFTWQLAPSDKRASSIQRIVVDTASLLPARWEVTTTAPTLPSSGVTMVYRFEYEKVQPLKRPEGAAAPECIPSDSFFPPTPK
jgi:hypothetical protein